MKKINSLNGLDNSSNFGIMMLPTCVLKRSALSLAPFLKSLVNQQFLLYNKCLTLLTNLYSNGHLCDRIFKKI